MHYSQGGGINPWDGLEKAVKQKMASEISWSERANEYESEINALRRKLEEEQAKLALKQQLSKKGE